MVKSGVREHCQFSLSLWTQQHKYAGALSLKATIFEVVQEEEQQVEKEWATYFSVIHSLRDQSDALFRLRLPKCFPAFLTPPLFSFAFHKLSVVSAHVFLFGKNLGKAEHQLSALRFLWLYLVTNKSAAWLMVTCVKKRRVKTYSHYTKYVRNSCTQIWLPVSLKSLEGGISY